MSRKEATVRLLPVLAFAVVTLIAAIKLPEPSWGIPLLGGQVVLMVLSIALWLPKRQQTHK